MPKSTSRFPHQLISREHGNKGEVLFAYFSVSGRVLGNGSLAGIGRNFMFLKHGKS